MCVLKCFSGLVVDAYVKHVFIHESFTFVKADVQKRSFCIDNFSRELDCRMMVICLI